MIRVSINGEELFNWESSVADASSIEQEVLQIADFNHVTPRQLAHVAVFNVLQRGALASASTEEGSARRSGEKNSIIWWLLSLPMDNRDLPGPFRDYIEAYHLDCDIMDDADDPSQFNLEVKATRFAGGSA